MCGEICHKVANGEPLTKICEVNGMPVYSTVMKWLTEDATFSEMYARAREDQADYLADQIVAIADEPVFEPKLETEDGEDGGDAGKKARMISTLDMERRRQRIESRKWVAAKLKPRAYGDKLDLTGSLDLKLPDEQVESRLAHLLRKAGTLVAVGGAGEAEGPAQVLQHVPRDGASEA